jgi:hypothetical protein
LLLPWASIEDANTILSACRSVENLWISTADRDLLPLLEDLPLKQLSCNLKALFRPQPIDFTHKLFSMITHLEVFGVSDMSGFDSPDHDKWRGLAHIPHLTNLSFNDDGIVGVWPALLRTCKSLRVLVVLQATIAGHPDEQELAKDPRFVAMGCEFETKDWRMGAHTGIDYWSRAEDLVAKRRSGEIDGAASRGPLL